MKYAHVRIIHIQDGMDIEGQRSRTAKILLDGVEVEGVTNYRIDSGLDYVRGGIVQKLTLEFYAEVEIEQVKQ